MTRLSDQLAEIGRELDILLAGDDNRRVIGELELATEELEPTRALLDNALLRRRALCGPPVNCAPYQFTAAEEPLYGSLRHAYETLREAWQDDPANVRQKGVVGEVRECADDYAEVVEKNNTGTWEEWKNSLEREFLIATAQIESIKNVLDYAGPITRYKQGVERFAALARQLPEDSHALQQMKTIAEELTKIKGGFVFVLPQKVLDFYNALDHDGHFQLARLDTEIKDWLVKNDGLKDLAIVRRRTIR